MDLSTLVAMEGVYSAREKQIHAFFLLARNRGGGRKSCDKKTQL